MHTGLYTAIITPFRDGKIDEEVFCNLIDEQIKAGVNGIVPGGTTGESPTLSKAEHIELIKLAVKHANGRIEVIAGTGSNATSEAIYLTQCAEDLGVSGSMQVTPYYNKPNQEGIFQHMSAVASATNLPIMLYSVPGRSVVPIEVETAVRLAEEHSNIVSIKEAGGCVGRVIALRKALPANFSILCGDDPLTLPFIAAGADGLVSVSSNIAPQQILEMVQACKSGDLKQARELFYNILPLTDTLMTIAGNPLPIKEACAIAGKCSDEFRLPLTNLPPDKKSQIRELLETFSII